MIKHLTVGYGEVGKAINAIVGGDYVDKDKDFDDTCEVMHICIPYSDDFISAVQAYKLRFKPLLTIIHSTVPIGTCRDLECVHSPIRGVHPHLEKSIRTMVKYFGGEQAELASNYFRKLGLETQWTKDVESVEALKLWSTTQYGVMILLNKEIHKFCEENNLDFDLIYTQANKTYNEGYVKLGREEVVRPYLNYVEGGIGGHCVVPNTKLFNSESTKRICNFQTQLQN